ncbi:hypothetical protein V8G54_022708 [Vigna mungo]|uniref:Uncharacterized protein n=1 Tax=Vigna mungo TaxID=3915 RepID=A0AAQ3N355_VIGMU
MAPRWKGKDAKAKKDAEGGVFQEPMSKIVFELKSSLVQSDTCGFLSDNNVQLAVGAEQLDLFDKACFGRPINGSGTGPQNDEELWHYMKSKKETFPCFYKAYSPLRMKIWVVRGEHKDLNGRLRVWSDVHCTTRLVRSVAKILLVLQINKLVTTSLHYVLQTILLKSAQSPDGVLNRTVKICPPDACLQNLIDSILECRIESNLPCET